MDGLQWGTPPSHHVTLHCPSVVHHTPAAQPWHLHASGRVADNLAPDNTPKALGGRIAGRQPPRRQTTCAVVGQPQVLCLAALLQDSQQRRLTKA